MIFFPRRGEGAEQRAVLCMFVDASCDGPFCHPAKALGYCDFGSAQMPPQLEWFQGVFSFFIAVTWRIGFVCALSLGLR